MISDDQAIQTILAAHRELIGLALALAAKPSAMPEELLGTVKNALVERGLRALQTPNNPPEIAPTYVKELESVFAAAQSFVNQLRR